jgi:DNA-binding NarL/FixJ family response regulator
MKKAPGWLKLSDREFQVFTFIAHGDSLKIIASKTKLSINTVATYRARIFKKMGFKTNVDLVNYSWKSGLMK